jgi:5'-nucleotidase / UDP-sugar diphosphatase
MGAESRKMAGSGLGNLVTDAFRHAMKIIESGSHDRIALAIEPVGMIRTDLIAGTITVDDVFRVMALGQGFDGKAGYPLVTFWLTGKEIRSLFEVETTLALQKNDAHLQISGMRFFYRADAPPFQRVQNVDVEDDSGGFSPLAEDRLYRVCTNLNMFLMRKFLQQASGGQISFVPKDTQGVPVSVLQSLVAHSQTLLRAPELKEWVALAMYLQSMRVDGETKPGELSGAYRTPQQRIFVLS